MLLHAFVVLIAIGVVYASTPMAHRRAPRVAAAPKTARIQPASAVCPSTLYVVDSNQIYSVDPASGTATLVAPVDPAYTNRRLYLRFAPDGTLYGRDTTNGRRIIMDIATGVVTDDGPDVDAIDAHSYWSEPTYLPEGSTRLGYEMKNTASGTLTAIRTVDSLEPFASSTLFPVSKPAAHNWSLGTAVSRDGTSLYWGTQDAVYRTAPASWSPFQVYMALNAFELSTDALMTDMGANDHFYIVDGNVLVDVNPVTKTSSAKSITRVSFATDVMLRPCPAGGVRVIASDYPTLSTSESGSTATFQLVLSAQPSANVTVTATSSDTNEGTVSPSTLTFTASNWNTPRSITVTGVHDFVIDGTRQYSITFATSSADAAYNGRAVHDLQVANADIDVAAIGVTPLTVALTAGGASVPITLSIATRPSADVVVPLTAPNATLSAPSVTFTNSDWSPKTVNVSAPASAAAGTFTVVTGLPITADANYATIDPADVSGSITRLPDAIPMLSPELLILIGALMTAIAAARVQS